MNTVVLFHKNCFDGICSAWVVSKKYPDAWFQPIAYGDDYKGIIYPLLNYPHGPNDPKMVRIIMVDISLSREIMVELHDFVRGEMIVLDHHKTAEEACKGLDFCIFDMNESGASMAWKYYFPDKEVPLLVRYIKDRDLWLFKETHSEIINSFIQSWPMTIKSYEMLNDMLDHDLGYERAIQGGASILRYKQTMVEAMCKNMSVQELGGYNVPVVNASMLFSEVGHELCKQWPEYPFAAYYFDRVKDGVRQWGLRSIGDFDVSVVAKQFGGGGHKNAAGFEQGLEDV